MSDILREVDEALRREKAEKFWKEYGLAVIGIAVAVVVAVAAASAWNHFQTRKAEDATAEIARTLKTEDIGARRAALIALADESSSPHADIARLFAAAFAEQGSGEAAEIFGQVAGNGRAPALLREFAALMSVRARLEGGGTHNAAGLAAELASVIDTPDSPWRLHALMTRAMLNAAPGGDVSAALADLDAVIAGHEAPATLRSRAARLRHVLAFRLEQEEPPKESEQNESE